MKAKISLFIGGFPFMTGNDIAAAAAFRRLFGK
jgi:hypothetical protein